MTQTVAFDVTTSFPDLLKALDEYAGNGNATTLETAVAAGATEVRLADPLLWWEGKTLRVGSGANAETVAIARVVSPPPREGGNIILAAPLQADYPAGSAAVEPLPLVPPAAVAQLRSLIEQARSQANSGDAAAAAATLAKFDAAVPTAIGSVAATAKERAALVSAGEALIAQVRNQPPPPMAGLGITTAPARPMIRIFTDPHKPVHNPNAKFKILVNGHAGGFRHEDIVDVEAMIQKLGEANAFDVDIWDPPGTQSPGRHLPPGISLAKSPFLSLATLKQYKLIVGDSAVGRDPEGPLDPQEFANLQAYIRGGGSYLSIHGSDDAFEDVHWYTSLVGSGFSGHGGNASGIEPDCPSCAEVELVNVDPSSPVTKGMGHTIDLSDELYNTSANPVELDLVHPILLENEKTLVGEINVGYGPLMNSARHGMAWCRDFDGGLDYTLLDGHGWYLTHQPVFENMVLGAIEAAAREVPGNCSTYVEAEPRLQAAVDAGSVSGAQQATLASAIRAARAAYDQGQYAKSLAPLKTLVDNTSGAGLASLHAEALQLTSWMQELSRH